MPNIPVLGIGSGNHDLNHQLIRAGLWDRRVDNRDLGALGHNGFLHDGIYLSLCCFVLYTIDSRLNVNEV